MRRAGFELATSMGYEHEGAHFHAILANDNIMNWPE